MRRSLRIRLLHSQHPQQACGLAVPDWPKEVPASAQFLENMLLKPTKHARISMTEPEHKAWAWRGAAHQTHLLFASCSRAGACIRAPPEIHILCDT